MKKKVEIVTLAMSTSIQCDFGSYLIYYEKHPARSGKFVKLLPGESTRFEPDAGEIKRFKLIVASAALDNPLIERFLKETPDLQVRGTSY